MAPAAASIGPNPQAVARYSAVIVPLMIIGIVSWATYVTIVEVAIFRLFQRYHQHGAGIAVIVLFCVLLFLTALCYFRILITVRTNPGYIPLGHTKADEKKRRSKGRRRRKMRGKHEREAEEYSHGPDSGQLDGGSDITANEPGLGWGLEQQAEKIRNLEAFRPKEVFVCDYDGLPIWCEKCACWKPDRTHHSSDVGRCVRRLDHFCPWVGGIVSETTMKFFIQFTFYAMFLGALVLITDAVVVVKDRHRNYGTNTQLAVLLGFSGLFTFFAVGIFGNTLHMTLQNLTSIEAINKGNNTYHLSVLITPAWYRGDINDYPFRTTTYPGAPGARYAILFTHPGDNPWDLGWLGNLKSVLGEKIWEWWLPTRDSPCTNHESLESDFWMGESVERLKRESAGY